MAESDWATPNQKEAPYWRKGMSIEEYEAERTYFFQHLKEFSNFTYQPMWKQKINNGKA